MTKGNGKTETASGTDVPYEVGRGKPPVATQFVKGRSGNPSGKPKGTRNRLPHLNEERLKDIVLEEAYRDITLSEGGQEATMPMAQAIVRKMAVQAVKGDPRSQLLFTRMLATIEQGRRELHDRWMDLLIDYKLKWEAELARREKLGLDLPDPVPHPDQITIDIMAGTFHAVGPWTKEEAALLKMFEERAEAEGRDLLELLMEERDRHREAESRKD
jgi:hypothetical protein